MQKFLLVFNTVGWAKIIKVNVNLKSDQQDISEVYLKEAKHVDPRRPDQQGSEEKQMNYKQHLFLCIFQNYDVH